MGAREDPSCREKSFRLIGPDGRPYTSEVPGVLGGNRAGRLYGRLDCPSARRAIARGAYGRNRVFFADEADAVAAGYRPCAVCLPDSYRVWKAGRAPLDPCRARTDREPSPIPLRSIMRP
ncbi:MAG: Ada metal-binding domain-containing protein [Gemmatimonadaceae bacterium]